MKFSEEFTFRLKVAPPIAIGEGPYRTRRIFEIVGGEVEGERIRGKMQGGADWGLIGSDGFLRIDVRTQIETHDGALLYVQYHGLLGLSETLRGALAKDGSTDFGDQYCYIHPRIETGDERYSWVNTTFFVGEGRAVPGGVEYRVWTPAYGGRR